MFLKCKAIALQRKKEKSYRNTQENQIGICELIGIFENSTIDIYRMVLLKK